MRISKGMGAVIVVLGLVMAAQVLAAAKAGSNVKPAATRPGKGGGDVEPQSITPLMSAGLTVSTNAQGQVTAVSLHSTGGSNYSLVTNGMSQFELKDLIKLNGLSVDCKGEIMQVDGKLAIKVHGKITVNAKDEEAKKKAAEAAKAAEAKKKIDDAAKKKGK